MRRLEWRHEEQRNELLSLENWVEKYIPLRLQHQIGDSLIKFIKKKN